MGELLLGYINEYGKYTDRPLVDPNAPGADVLPAAENDPTRKDLGRNGTFVVMRTLEQDVAGFWSFIERQSGSPDERQELAAHMVGRTREGEPLAKASAVQIPGIDPGPKGDQNRFTFDDDPAGTRCPLGAHIRRANPRNTDYPDRPSNWFARVLSMLGWASRASKGFQPDIMASARFHRIVRRGREYAPGSPLKPSPINPPADPTRPGIHFLCLNAATSSASLSSCRMASG